MTIEIIRTALGWCAVINIALLALSSISVIAFRRTMSRFHGKLFDLDEKYLQQVYFQYLAQYKIAVIVLNIVPYFALRIAG